MENIDWTSPTWFERFYDHQQWTVDPRSLLPGLPIFEHIHTKRLMAWALRANPNIQDRIVYVGCMFYFRLGENQEMNTEMSFPLPTDPFSLAMFKTCPDFIHQQYEGLGPFKDDAEKEQVQRRFLQTLLENTTIRISSSDPPKLNLEKPTQKDEDEEEDSMLIEADHILCCICMDKPADTMVLPCMHRSVCRSCSERLKTTHDAHVCVRCRQPLEHVLIDDSLLSPNDEKK